jgi:O-antigen biosynthesis protein
MLASTLRAAAARLPSRTSNPQAPAGERVPLSALRARLDEGSAHVNWSMDPDGVLGRALAIPAGGTCTVPLTLGGEVFFSARAMLFPHDWRDLDGAMRAVVTIATPHQPARELWSGTLHASDRGAPRGLPVSCRLPAETTALALSVHSVGAGETHTLNRAIWVDPLIVDPHAPAWPALTRPTPDTQSRPGGDPVISILVPVHDPPPHMLREAIASVTTQTYSHWELCLVDDGSTDPAITTALQRHAASDPRIHLTRHDHAQGISAATNAAMQSATGDYIALLDHDDTLTPDALQHVADQIATQPDLDMIYSDEDILQDGRQMWVHLKPAWSPDTLRTNGYTCHLGVYRRSLVNEIGGFRTEFNGSQDVDMILRLVERTDRVAHIPRILYHWRAHADSTAGGDAKPYAYVAARNAIAAHLERTGLQADVGYGPPGLYRVAHRVPRSTSVDIVLAVDNADGLDDAGASWIGQAHPTWQVVLAAPAHLLEHATAALTAAGVPNAQITAITTDPDADLATALTTAAATATAEHLLLMHGPAIGLTHDWLTRLLGYSNQPGIAAAGPVILSPDGRIQDAGIAIPDGIPLPLLHGLRSSMDNLFGYGTSVYNVSAISGVLATRRDTYETLGGLHTQYGDLAVVDYCLRAGEHRQRTVIVPDVRLRATGPNRTVNDLPAIWRLRRAWAQTHTHDPYYNPNYRTDRGDFEHR